MKFADNQLLRTGKKIVFVEHVDDANSEIGTFFLSYGGMEFGGGIYRTHTPESSRRSLICVERAYPNLRGRLTCVGYDWLGRQFVLDSERRINDHPAAAIFDLSACQSYKVPADLRSLHEQVFIEKARAALCDDFFSEWLGAGNPPPKYHQCVGYKKPPFLGGDEDLPNMEISDMDVYLELCSQLIAKVKGL